jgi:hypothetical protein
MGIQRAIYQALKYANDVKAVRRAVEQGSVTPITRRAGRRVYGKLTGRLARKLFG